MENPFELIKKQLEQQITPASKKKKKKQKQKQKM